jgi:hypothetical protein
MAPPAPEAPEFPAMPEGFAPTAPEPVCATAVEPPVDDVAGIIPVGPPLLGPATVAPPVPEPGVMEFISAGSRLEHANTNRTEISTIRFSTTPIHGLLRGVHAVASSPSREVVCGQKRWQNIGAQRAREALFVRDLLS